MANLKSKGVIVTVVAVVLILVLVVFPLSAYSGLVHKDEAVLTAWANVQTQYQRRSDLIPNLVNTVKGYAAHEKETLESVMAARSKATQITMSTDDITPEKMKQMQEAQGELSAALGKLLAITENYPNLKANENFSELQSQLEGTENRIAESRRLYNESVRVYNVEVRLFPTNIVAGLFGFEKRAPFEAESGAQNAPTVQF